MEIDKLRKRVIEVKRKKRLTYRAMSEMSGIHSSVLQKFASGVNPHKNTAIKIAKAFYPNWQGLNKKEEPAIQVNSSQFSTMKWR